MTEIEKMFENVNAYKMLCNCEFKNLYDYRIEYGSDVCDYTESKIKELLDLANKGGALLVAESTKDNKYKQALEEIRSYCDEQNLKADYTACYITNRIDEVLNDN